ncbi:MAG: N-6 DNA methylase [Candidatus Gastranaerophilales bacterium]|nr:N-6 DNA methylase [Candidatus Gastranaerophilales bacterium]
MNTMPLEKDTIYLINRSLENLGWKFEGKDKNVYQEQPRTEAERRVLEHKRPDYVLYSKDHEPLIVIEAKKKGERIDSALEQGIFYAKKLKAPLVFATDGVFCKSFHTQANKTPLLNGEELDEFIREAMAMKFLGEWNVNTVSQKVQYDRQELIKIFDTANNMLRSEGLRAGEERFGEFANILFLKLISESEQNKLNMGIHTDFNFSTCSWDIIKKQSSSSRVEYINNMVYKKLNDLYNTEIFTSLKIRDNDVLKEIMGLLDPLVLTDIDSDVKGDAFEYFLKASTATKNDLGEYFTPRHIVKTMVRLVNPQIGEKVYDPFCGTGGFLIESFRHIYNNMPRNKETEKMLRENTIFGNEITSTARITKMNMILAGDGHSGIHMQDSLANPVEGKYDVVLANMPYSQRTKHGSLYDLPSTNGDSICVQHCMKAISSTSENGRMAIVVPEGFLFKKELAKTREYLLENSELQSIISLPQGVFLPYTSVKTNIIYATKINQKIAKASKRSNFWYFEVKSDGYSLDNHRRKLETPSDLQKYEEFRKFDSEQEEEMFNVGFNIIPLEKVAENRYILLGNRYKARKSVNTKYGTVQLNQILDYEQPTKYIVHSTEYNDKFPTPVLTAGKTFLLGYTDERDGIYQATKENPVIIFDDFTTATKLVDFPFKVKSSAMKILKTKKNDINIRYAYYAMNGIKFNSITHKRYWLDEFSKLHIPLPSLQVQNRIVEELDSYQQIIDGAKKIVDNYKPNIKIRPEYNMVKVEDVVDFISGVTLSVGQCEDKNGIPLITIADVDENGTIIYDTIRKVRTSKNTTKLQKGDLLFNWRNGSKHLVGKTALFDKEGEYIFASFLLGLRPRKSVDNRFLWIILNQYRRNGIYLNQMRQQVNGLFNREELKDILIPLPPIEEQKEIVAKIEAEQALIEPNKQIIEVFSKKIQDRISEIFQ